MNADELRDRATRRLRSGEELRERVRALRAESAGRTERARPEIDLDPASVYELLTRQMVGDLAEELREIRLRVNGLVFVTVGAVVADIVLRLVR
jgi:uncharacterized protein YjeT (DUF2065 family)